MKLEGSYIIDVSSNVSANTITSNFENESLQIIDHNGSFVSDDSAVGTGCKVQIVINGEIIDSLTIIVSGDVDGNGNVDSTDYIRIKSAFLGSLDLNEAYTKAADVDESSKIDSTDYIRIKGHFLGTYNLYK